MQQRNATLRHFFRLASLTFFLTALLILGAAPLANGATANSLVAEPQLQSTNDLPFPFVLPNETGKVSLSTHIVNLLAFSNEQNEISLSANALFRLKNNQLAPVATTIRISSPISGLLPADLAVTLDNAPAGVYVAENGALSLNVELAAESSADLTLTYSFALPSGTLRSIRYPAAMLTSWQQRISTSIRIQLPQTVLAESVVQIAPDDWIFPADADENYAVRWLFDGLPPEQPFSLSFIEPTLWQQILQAREAAATGSAADALRLGDLYGSLLSAASGELRDGFYAQSLAAYNDGIQQSTDPALSADLQRRLAQLYRSQIVNANGVVSSDYAQLTISAVDAALGTMNEGDERYRELLQWRTDALTVLFGEARRRNDWSSARQILDQLSQSAEQSGNSAFVADIRRRLVVQQALELLADGNREAAITLAGQEIGAAELRAPDELASLFESWQITATVGPDGTEVDWIGLPVAEKSQAALNELQSLLNTWRTRSSNLGYQLSLEPLPVLANQQIQPLHLRIRIPASVSAMPLAEATTLRSDWALFRLLLSQLAVEVNQSPQLFRQEISMHLPVDLRSVAEQWNAMAANLEQRAAAFESQANVQSSGTDEEAEALLRARIQLANYRGAAKVWSSLARNSSIAITLTANRANTEQSRTWLLTPASPAQSLDLNTTIINWGRVLAVAGAALFLLFVLSGVLWWLL